LIEVASNDKKWVSYDAATGGDHNAKGFIILARSICEIMAKKSKLWHFSTPPISQEKSHMESAYYPRFVLATSWLHDLIYGADFWFCQIT
jgi:hypothetical protein